MYALLTAMFGFILPQLIQYLNDHVANQKYRFLISVFASLLVGIAMTAANGGLRVSSTEDIITSATLSFAASQVAYALYFKDKFRAEREQ